MAEPSIILRSSVPGKAPTIEQIDFGQLAINTSDGIIYFKSQDSAGGPEVVNQLGGAGGGSVNDVNITLSAGAGILDGGIFTTNQTFAEVISFKIDSAVIPTLARDNTFTGATTLANLTISGLLSQPAEATAVTVNGSGLLGFRELGSNAFNSTPIPSAPNNATITLSAGNGLITGGAFTTNQGSNETITFTMGTPSTLTGSTTNAVTASSHTHEIDETGFSFSASQITSGLIDSARIPLLHIDNDTTGNLPLTRTSGTLDSSQIPSLDINTDTHGIIDSAKLPLLHIDNDTTGNLPYTRLSGTPTIGDGTITIAAGDNLDGGGTFTVNQTGNTTITLNLDSAHNHTAAQITSGVFDSARIPLLHIDNDTTGDLPYSRLSGTPTIGDATITLSAGDGLDSGGSFTTNQSGIATITFNVDSTVVRTTGAQSISGVKTFNDAPVFANGGSMTSGHLTLSNGVDVRWEGGLHRITNNDGGGNFNIRHNNYYSSGDLVSVTGKSTHLEFHDGTDNNTANLEINASRSRTANTTMGTAAKFYFYNELSSYGAAFRIANGGLVIGTNEVITIAGALQNVTGNAAIINSGIFDSARIPTLDINADTQGILDSARLPLLHIDNDTTGNLPYTRLSGTPTIGDATITLSAGSGLLEGGDFTTNQTGNETITFKVDSSAIPTLAGTNSFSAVNTFTGTEVLIERTVSPTLRLNQNKVPVATDSDGPRIIFETDTTGNQGVQIYHELFDVNLPETGYGLVIGPGPDNTQWPATGDLTFNVLGNIYAGGETIAALSRVLTTADEGSGNGLDADTLDGQEGTYYNDAANLTGTIDSARLPLIHIDNDTTGDLPYTRLSGTPTIGDATITLAAGDGLDSGGSFTTNQTGIATITFNVDSTVVRTTGTQTIVGNKTFTGQTELQGTPTNPLVLRSTDNTGSSNAFQLISDFDRDLGFAYINGVTGREWRTWIDGASDDNFIISANGTGNIVLELDETDYSVDVVSGSFKTAGTIRITNAGVLQNVTGDAAIITSGIFDSARIPILTASDIVGGIFDSAQIPSLDINTDTHGILDSDRLPPTVATNNATITLDAGAGLLIGGDFTVNQVANETITFQVDSSTIPTLAANNIFTGTNTFNEIVRHATTAGTVVAGDFVQTATYTSTAQQTFASIDTATWGGGKAIINATRGSDRHITELMIVHDTTTATATEYGIVTTNGELATYDVDISGGNFRILITPNSATSTKFDMTMKLMDV